jgi:4-hydroxy-tetrahydrodipicolinate synthase
MFHGSLVALVTPMLLSNEIDYAALEKIVDWHLNQHTDGLVVLGTTGEAPTIESQERAKIIRQVIAQAAGKIPVIVGTGVNATSHTIALTRQAMELGADAALLVTPYYNKPSQEGLFQHFQAVANAVPIPQILYNVPSRTGCDLLPETVARLSKIANIVALKEATGDLNRLKKILETEQSLDLFSGDDKTAMEFMLLGGKGVISVVANISPHMFHDLCVAAVNGDRKEAERINQKLEMLYTSLFLEANPIPVKWAMAEMGLITKGIRLPLTPLNEKFRTPLHEAMQRAEIRV